MKIHSNIFFIFTFFAFVMAACSPAADTQTVEGGAPENQAEEAAATETSAPAATETPQATATPAFEIISPSNADKVTLVDTWTGHTTLIYGVTFSPDGSMLASAPRSDSVRVWDVATGIQLFTLDYQGESWNTSYSPDGKILAVRADESTVILFDVSTQSELRRLSGTKIGWRVAFSPDGTTLAATSFDGFLKLWDVESGDQLFGESGHPSLIESVAFSPDGSSLATAGDDSVKLWELSSGALQRTFNIGERVTFVDFSPDGSQLVVTRSSFDGTPDYPSTMTVWDVASGSKLRMLSDAPDLPRRAVYSPDGQLLVVQLNRGTLVFYDAATGSELHRIPDDSDTNILGLDFSPDGRLIVTTSGFDIPVIRIWGIQP